MGPEQWRNKGLYLFVENHGLDCGRRQLLDMTFSVFYYILIYYLKAVSRVTVMAKIMPPEIYIQLVVVPRGSVAS